MASYRLSVVIEEDANSFFARCPELQGCYAQGKTYAEALANIRDAIKLHIKDRLAAGESIPSQNGVTLTTLEVAV